MDELIKQAESLGIKVFKSWDEDRLKAEIAKVAGTGDSTGSDSEADAAAEADAKAKRDAEEEAAADELAAEEQRLADEKAKADSDLQAEIDAKAAETALIAKAREDALMEAMASTKEPEDRTVTIRNLKANPMRALGLDSYGSATFTEAQLSADATLVQKIERGVLLGLLKVDDE